MSADTLTLVLLLWGCTLIAGSFPHIVISFMELWKDTVL
jgi:hypothetical protein